MALPFVEAMARLRSPGCEACRYPFSASFLDEEDYARLGDWYDEAVAALTASDGPPLEPTPRIAEPIDVERVACWRRPGGLAFALLSWGDNTRVRYLEIGLAARGTLFTGCWGQVSDEPCAATHREPGLAERMKDAWSRNGLSPVSPKRLDPPPAG